MFFLFENHTGDDNDNSIDDLVVEAPSAFAALDYLDRKLRSKHRTAQTDGDETHVTSLWYRGDRPFHDDFYLQSSHATQSGAEQARARYHGWLGTIKARKASVRKPKTSVMRAISRFGASRR